MPFARRARNVRIVGRVVAGCVSGCVSGWAPLAVVTLVLSSPGLAAPVLRSADTTETVLLPGAVVMPDGTLAKGKAVVIRDGRIAAVESAEAHAGREDAIRRPGTVLSPGLIDPYSALGVVGGNVENVNAIDPALDVFAAADFWDSAWSDALTGGITAVMIVPGSTNLIGGTAAVIRTGTAAHPPETLLQRAGMLFSLGTPALSPRRAPTSRGGAIAMLRNAFGEARTGGGSPRMQAVLDGTLVSIVRADAGEDVTAALRFFETYGLEPIIVHRDDLLDVLDDLVESPVPLIVGPYGFDAPRQALAAPARLHAAGVEFAFAGNTPLRDGAALRLSAALAVRAGLDPAAARRALTANPARMLGIETLVGTIEAGRDADLVLFTHDPLRPDARVLEVWLRGTLVHAAADLHDEIGRTDSETYGEGESEQTLEGVGNESE